MPDERRQYATDKQVRAAAARAKAVGIERIGALTLSPSGAITIIDASLARRFATEQDDGAQALSEGPTPALALCLALLRATLSPSHPAPVSGNGEQPKGSPQADAAGVSSDG